jgi:hypothetical protein
MRPRQKFFLIVAVPSVFIVISGMCPYRYGDG